MKKAILAFLLTLCLLSMLFLKECKISVKANPMTWTVDDDGPADFHTIQEAINNAISGDTIFVLRGTYNESVAVNKTVSLIGENRDSTIVDANGTNSVISMTAGNVNIQGFTLRNSGIRLFDSGIYIDRRSSGNSISHNTILNNNDGISLYSSSNNAISSNTISNNTYNGIVLYSSSSNVFLSNTISNNSDGISLYSSRNNVISSNAISDNSDGIYPAFDSSNNTIYRNNFRNDINVQTDSINLWDYGGEGNYWSDYKWQDLNEDGKGEIPYVIDLYNQDMHPLGGMFSEFSIALETKAYTVTIICNSTISELVFEIGVETGNRLIRFNVIGEDSTVGFCRIGVPTELMKYPYIVLAGSREVTPRLLEGSNEAYVRLYFTYSHRSHNIAIISSKMTHLYNELLDNYLRLLVALYDLNTTYYGLLDNYHDLSVNYSQLQESLDKWNASYQRHLSDYSQHMQNSQSLMYIFAATTAIFIVTTVYLSKIAHAGMSTKNKESRTE